MCYLVLKSRIPLSWRDDPALYHFVTTQSEYHKNWNMNSTNKPKAETFAKPKGANILLKKFVTPKKSQENPFQLKDCLIKGIKDSIGYEGTDQVDTCWFSLHTQIVERFNPTIQSTQGRLSCGFSKNLHHQGELVKKSWVCQSQFYEIKNTRRQKCSYYAVKKMNSQSPLFPTAWVVILIWGYHGLMWGQIKLNFYIIFPFSRTCLSTYFVRKEVVTGISYCRPNRGWPLQPHKGKN